MIASTGYYFVPGFFVLLSYCPKKIFRLNNTVLLQIESKTIVTFVCTIALTTILIVLLNALGAILINLVWEAIKRW